MEQEEARCHFCGSPDVTDEDYCYGCGVYICQACSFEEDEIPAGRHKPEDHDIGFKRGVDRRDS